MPKSQIDVWVNEDFILDNVRPHPVLMHLSAPDIDPELKFWNLLRDRLNSLVKVNRFEHLDEAGRFVVIPNPLQDYVYKGRLNEVLKFKDRVLESGRIPILTTGAFEYAPKPEELVFSTSTYGSANSSGTIATPGWLFDFGAAAPIAKPTKPTVGFVGAANYPGRLNTFLSGIPIPAAITDTVMCSSLINRSLSLGMRQPFAQWLRTRVLTEAVKAPELQTNFINRKSGFFAQTIEERKQAKSEYIQNIQANAYTICVRGTENYSYRLYEVMSVGRIPIIIDTNLQLPDLSGFGEWREFSVIVPLENIDQIGRIVQEFHSGLSDKEFKQACSKARAAFEYLLPHNFFLRALKTIEPQPQKIFDAKSIAKS